MRSVAWGTGDVGGTVSTRREVPGNDDAGGAARGQLAQSPMEQPGQGELHGRGDQDNKDAGIISGIVLAEQRAYSGDLVPEGRWKTMSRAARKRVGKNHNKHNQGGN